MGFRIVIAGESQCVSFAESCLLADFLCQNLPEFSYDRVVVSAEDWKAWLCRINQKNKWHHVGSPIIWKEMLMAGSKPYYIGGGSQFLDYCYSYYKFESLFGSEKYEKLLKNYGQYKNKLSIESKYENKEEDNIPTLENPSRKYVFTISGAGNPLTMYLIVGLLELDYQKDIVSKIYLYDENCSEEFMKSIENQCAYIPTSSPSKVVKYVNRIGNALTRSDLFIIMDHVPFDEKMAIGEWLHANKEIMDKLSVMVNASGARHMYIVFPNLGPACFNATCLRKQVTIDKDHIVVATSDLGMEISPIAAEIANISSRNMFCPPVWGFVGINHLVDIKTTVLRYDTFQPYNRVNRVKHSTLKIGSLTPEFRMMEYLMFFDNSLWKKVAEMKTKHQKGQPRLNKAVAVLNLVKLWFFQTELNDVFNLGLHCDGSFGLKFDGIFSQPARLINREWVPAKDYVLPKDSQMNIYYLEEMAEWIMKLQRSDLPPLVPYFPCSCKPKPIKKKNIWQY